MWKLFVSKRPSVCLADITNKEQYRVRGGINQTFCVQPPPAARRGQVVQREVHSHQQPQRLLPPHSQVTPEQTRQSLQQICVSPLIILCFICDLCRNNLTVIDTIVLHGRGTTESLKVAGKPPGQGSSLRFKMTEALLKDCTESECVVQIGLNMSPVYT